MPRPPGVVPHPSAARLAGFGLAALLLLAAAPAAAQVTSYAGQWNVEATFNLPDMGGICVYQGVANVMQDGAMLSGSLVMSLVTGPGACPAEMMASLTGSVGTVGIELGVLLGGQLGEAQFSGSDQETGVLEGRVMVVGGPFDGATGSWAAARRSVLEIPTLSALGLAALVTLLLAAGAWFLRRRIV